MAGLRELLAAGDAYRVIGRVKDYFSALPRAKITPQLLQDFQLDFTQLLYGALSERQIEAHQLFSLPDVQTLYSRAGSSLIDTLKWVSFITQQVTDAIQSSSRAQTSPVGSKPTSTSTTPSMSARRSWGRCSI